MKPKLKFRKPSPKLRKKLKIFLGISVVGLILSGAFAVYLGFMGMKYVAATVSTPEIAEHAETLRSKVEQIPALTVARCLDAAQSFADIESLLATPILRNLQTLQQACFSSPAPALPSKEEKGELI